MILIEVSRDTCMIAIRRKENKVLTAHRFDVKQRHMGLVQKSIIVLKIA